MNKFIMDRLNAEIGLVEHAIGIAKNEEQESLSRLKYCAPEKTEQVAMLHASICSRLRAAEKTLETGKDDLHTIVNEFMTATEGKVQ